jgi:hypothetical protein
MAGKRATIEVGDLVEFRSQDKIQKFYYIWHSTAIVTDIYESTKGKNKGRMMAKVFFATKREYRDCKWHQVPYNKEFKILLKRFKKVR